MRRLFVVPMLFLIVLAPAAVAATGLPPVPPVQSVAEDAPPADFGEARTERRQAEARVDRRERRSRAKAQAPVVPPVLQAIAACESGGNPRAVSADGRYHGLFQFDQTTWNSVGGEGDPAAASVAEQVKRAEILYAQAGPGQWPVCGA